MIAEFKEFDAALRDGRSVHLRLAGPADEAAYLRAFDRLDPRARYMRFMRVVVSPNREALRKVLASFPANGFAIVATAALEGDTEIVGSAICMMVAGSRSCEFAMTVAAEYAGAGLGRLLLSTLVDVAKRHELEQMTGYVLAANQPMLRLAKRMGFDVSPDPDDVTARMCRLNLLRS
jgi:acetyltransferase